MQGNSRFVSTNQLGVHEKLQEVVQRHLNTQSQKPIQPHTEHAFEQVQNWLASHGNKPIVLDSCCGIGESTWRLAEAHKDCLIIGVDKSLARLEKHGQQREYRHYFGEKQPQEQKAVETAPVQFQACDNYCVVRADVIDFWRLIRRAEWQIQAHYLFYPNPYPKGSQLQKRWHASPSFQDIIAIGGQLTVRSNWQIYIEEFSAALALLERDNTVSQVPQTTPFTPFERKYWNSGQQSWQVVCHL